MFFEHENFSAQIFAVDLFDCGTRAVSVKPRPFAALALRIRGEASFRFADGTELISHEGDVIYIPAGMAYEAVYDSSFLLGFHFWWEAEGDRAESFPAASIRAQESAELFEHARTLFTKGTPAARMEVVSIFYKILSILAQSARGAAVERAALTRAVELLTAEYVNPDLSLPDVCRRASIPESSFRRLFYARYAKPPIKFLTELRLAEAQKRLAGTRDTVEAVAHACGFRDVKYFSRVIKRHFGCTPGELRRL